jgi:putative transposase
VFIPKYRRKKLFGHLRESLGKLFHALAQQRESRILEGHLMPDHVHMLISIPPKYSVSQVISYIKGKRAIHIAREHMGRGKNYT